jgi:F-type H+-transporting ATPase subunit delta
MNYAETVLARRYATALLRVCGDQFSQEDIDSLKHAVTFFKTHKAALYFLALPDLAARSKKDIVKKLFELVKLPACFQSLVRLLARHKRLRLLAPVLMCVIALYQEQHGIMNVHVQSSSLLDDAQLQVVRAFLSDKTGKKIIYTYAVKKDLIAGIRLQSDTLLWEYSVRKKLRAIRLSVIR